jgi:hypothetical protein
MVGRFTTDKSPTSHNPELHITFPRLVQEQGAFFGVDHAEAADGLCCELQSRKAGHNRHGHLFQNRYKSIVCEEDSYLMELVRYIHLNPLRAGVVHDLEELNRSRWSGHSALMGKVKGPGKGRGMFFRFLGVGQRLAWSTSGS